MHRTGPRVGLRVGAHQRGQPDGIRRVRRRRVLRPRASPPARARPRRRTGAGHAAAREGDPPRPARRARGRRRLVRRVLAARARRAQGRARPPRPPAASASAATTDRVVAYAITGVAGRYGYLQRVAVAPGRPLAGLGSRRSWPTASAGSGSTAATASYVNTQLENERALALYSSFGFDDPPRGPVRPRPVAVTVAAARSRAACSRPSLLVAASGDGRGASRRPRARTGRKPVVRARGPERLGGAERRLRHEVPERERARRAAGRAHHPRPRGVAHRVRRQRQRRQPAAVARTARPSRSTRSPPTPPAQRVLRVPDHRDHRRRRVPARGRPAERERRVARPLRHPRGRRAAWAPTARSTVGVAAAGRVGLAAARRSGLRRRDRADQPDHARRPPARPGGSDARPRSSRPTPTFRSRSPRAPRPSTPGPRSAAGIPDLSAGAAQLRSTVARDQVLTGPFVPARSPVDRRRRPRRRGEPRARAAGSPPSRPSSARTSTRAPRSPGPSTRIRSGSLQNASARQLVLDGDASSRRPTRSTRPRTRTRCRRYRATTPARSRWSPPTRGSSSSSPVTTRPPCAPRTSSPGSRSSPASSRASPAASRSPTPTGGTPTTRSSAAVLGRTAREPAPPPDDGRRTARRGADGDRRRRARRRAGVPAARAVRRRPNPPVTVAAVPARRRRTATRSPTWSAPTIRAPSAADRALATSVSADWAEPGRPGTGAATSSTSIGTSVDGLPRARSEVQPPGTITITSSKAEIPISFQNTSDQTVTVHVKLESDRLLFPDGAERDVVLPAQRSTTVRVAVETRGSGTSPVQHDGRPPTACRCPSAARRASRSAPPS